MAHYLVLTHLEVSESGPASGAASSAECGRPAADEAQDGGGSCDGQDVREHVAPPRTPPAGAVYVASQGIDRDCMPLCLQDAFHDLNCALPAIEVYFAEARRARWIVPPAKGWDDGCSRDTHGGSERNNEDPSGGQDARGGTEARSSNRRICSCGGQGNSGAHCD